MRALLFATDAYGGYGGIAQYNRDFAEALACMPDVTHVELLVRVATEKVSPSNKKITQYTPVKSRLLYALKGLYLILRRRPDIIVSGHIYHGILVAPLAKLFRIPLVTQLHGTEVWNELGKLHKWPIRASDLVLCVSEDTKLRIMRQIEGISNRAKVVHNTVGDEFVIGDRSQARDSFNLGDEFIILTVGRLDARNGYKGHDKIISILPALKLHHSKGVKYLICGIGEDRGRLEALAANLGVSDEVVFLGNAPRSQLPNLYRAADLFALPSTGEGFGIVYIEAMSCGTRAIGLNVGGAPDALLGGALGTCVDEAEFESALIELSLAPERDPARLAERTRAHFGRKVFRKNIVRALEVIMPRHKRYTIGHE